MFVRFLLTLATIASLTTVARGAPAIYVTRSQIPTTTISSEVQSFITAGYASVFDGGEGCEWTRATVSAPGAVQSADGAYWALSRTSAIDIKCVGGLASSSDVYPALVAASQIARAPNPGIDSFGQILISNKYPYLTLATPGLTTYNGEGINGCAAGTAVINTTFTSGTAITTTGGGVNLDCLALIGATGNHATGFQLGVGASDQAGQQRVVRDTTVRGFERGIYSASGAGWQFSNVVVDNFTTVGVEIDNPTCDAGDWFINGLVVGGPDGATYPTSKGVKWDCSGGGKITGLKIFYGAYGWYSAPTAGTVDMQFAANSIEGQSVAGMYFVSNGGSLGHVTIASSEFGGLPEGIVLVSGVAAVTFVGNTCANIGIACIRIEDGVGRVVVGSNDYDPNSVPIIDNRVNALSMWGHLDRDYDRPVAFSSDSVWTDLASYTIPMNGYSTKLTLFFEGQLSGSGFVTRDMTMILKNTGSGVSVYFDRDITTTTGGIFDLNIRTSGNTMTVEVRRQSGVGTNFFGTMTQHVEGPLQSYRFL
ncbi:hypothetical protein [Methylosinus sp. RM1]|uniref:hypothetical protein n=1 Tax=Methylosinus sp. RM1 TaxID=2583817 RepID=UPI001409BF71|nr:hypothetical protein [Methylosinus sp. RM1]